jgi:hypothetical protein
MPLHLRLLTIASMGFLAGTLDAGPAWARYNCGVKGTADGFVALRDGPSASRKLIARMKKGELVGLLHPPDYEKIVRRGGWLFVRYVPGSKFSDPNAADYDKAVPGWVNDRLLECHE